MDSKTMSRWPGRFFTPDSDDGEESLSTVLKRLALLIEPSAPSKLAPTRPFVNKRRLVIRRKEKLKPNEPRDPTDDLFGTSKRDVKLVAITRNIYEFSDTAEFAEFRTHLTDESNFGIMEIALDRTYSIDVLRYTQLLFLWKYTMLENFLNYPRVACFDMYTWTNSNVWDISPTLLTHEVIHAFYGLLPAGVSNSMTGVVLKLRKAFMADGTCIYDSNNILSHQHRNSIQTDLVSLLVYEQVEVAVHGAVVENPLLDGFAYAITSSTRTNKSLEASVLELIKGDMASATPKSNNTHLYAECETTAQAIRNYNERTFVKSQLSNAAIMVYKTPLSRQGVMLKENFLTEVPDDGYLVCGAVLSVIMDSVILYQKPSKDLVVDLFSAYNDQEIEDDLTHFLEMLESGIDWRLFPPGCGKSLIDEFLRVEPSKALSSAWATHERDPGLTDLKLPLFLYQRASKTIFPLEAAVEDAPFLRIKGKSQNMVDEADSDSEQFEISSFSDEVSDVSAEKSSFFETGATSSGGASTSRSYDANSSIIQTAKTKRTKNTKQENRQVMVKLWQYQDGKNDRDINVLRRADTIYQLQALASVAIGSIQNELNLPNRHRTLENCLLGYGVWNGNSNKSMLYAAGDVFKSSAWETSDSLNATRLEWRHSLFVLSLAFYFDLSLDSVKEAWEDPVRVLKLTRHLQDYMLYRPRVDVWFLNYFDIELLEGVKTRKDSYGRLIRELNDEFFVIEPFESAKSRIIRHDHETGEEIDMVDVFPGLHITETLVPLLAPSIAEDDSEDSKAATFYPVTSNPDIIKNPKFLRTMAGVLYWTCLLAGTDALRLYGPLAIASMVIGSWRDYIYDDDDAAATRQQIPIANHVRQLFMDDCIGVDILRSSTGRALTKTQRSRDIQRLIDVPPQYITILDSKHPLVGYLKNDILLSTLFLRHGEFPDTSEGEELSAKKLENLVGIDGPAFIRDLFSKSMPNKG